MGSWRGLIIKCSSSTTARVGSRIVQVACRFRRFLNFFNSHVRPVTEVVFFLQKRLAIVLLSERDKSFNCRLLEVMLTPVKLKPTCQKLRSTARFSILGEKMRKKTKFFSFFSAVFFILLRMLVLSTEVCWFRIIWLRPNLAVRVCVRFPLIGCGRIAGLEASLQVQVQIVSC